MWQKVLNVLGILVSKPTLTPAILSAELLSVLKAAETGAHHDSKYGL